MWVCFTLFSSRYRAAKPWRTPGFMGFVPFPAFHLIKHGKQATSLTFKSAPGQVEEHNKITSSHQTLFLLVLRAKTFHILHKLALRSIMGCSFYGFCSMLSVNIPILHTLASGTDLRPVNLPHPPHLLWRNPVLAWKSTFFEAIWIQTRAKSLSNHHLMYAL